MSLESVWKNCLEFIRDNIQEQAYKTWFEPIQPIKLDDNILSIKEVISLSKSENLFKIYNFLYFFNDTSANNKFGSIKTLDFFIFSKDL